MMMTTPEILAEARSGLFFSESFSLGSSAGYCTWLSSGTGPVLATIVVQVSFGVVVVDGEGEAVGEVGLAAAAMTLHLPTRGILRRQGERRTRQGQGLMLRAGGQASGLELQLAQLAHISPATEDKRNGRQVLEDGVGEALITEKVARTEGQGRHLRRARPFHQRGIQALGLGARAGDDLVLMSAIISLFCCIFRHIDSTSIRIS